MTPTVILTTGGRFFRTEEFQTGGQQKFIHKVENRSENCDVNQDVLNNRIHRLQRY